MSIPFFFIKSGTEGLRDSRNAKVCAATAYARGRTPMSAPCRDASLRQRSGRSGKTTTFRSPYSLWSQAGHIPWRCCQWFPQCLRALWHSARCLATASFRLIDYLRRRKGYVFSLVCLSVCLFVCLSVGLLANLWTDFDEIFCRVGHGSGTKWYNFGGDPDHASDPGVQSPKSGSFILLTNCVMPCSAEVCALWAYSSCLMFSSHSTQNTSSQRHSVSWPVLTCVQSLCTTVVHDTG